MHSISVCTLGTTTTFNVRNRNEEPIDQLTAHLRSNFFFVMRACQKKTRWGGGHVSQLNMNDPLEWYNEIPIISRVYLTGSFLTTVACALDLISPFSLYFNFNLIFYKGQVWRLITNFLFFGLFSLDFLFHMYFLYVQLFLDVSIYSALMLFGLFIESDIVVCWKKARFEVAPRISFVCYCLGHFS